MENYEHFILSNRKVKWNSKEKIFSLDLDSRIQPGLPLHYTVYDFTGKKLTEHSDLPNKVTPVADGAAFIDQVVAAADQLPEGSRNVTFYIHGFHHIFQRSFKLDILSGMANSYCSAANRVVGKFIFFSWPATEGRNILDDRAHAQGIMLYRNNKKMFENLAAALQQKGIQFNLMAHSFGHRILNGFLEEINTGKKIFDKVFLFAADIPHQALDGTLPGIKLKNKKNSDWDGDTPADDVERWYNLTKLQEVANETHCFYCKYDRMLMASTDGELKRTEEDDADQVNDYLCLGTMGNLKIKPNTQIKFYDVEKWVRVDTEFGDVLGKNAHEVEQMQKIIDALDLSRSDHRAFAILNFSREPWVKLHRYAYYSKDVVKEVGNICRAKQTPVTPVIA